MVILYLFNKDFVREFIIEFDIKGWSEDGYIFIYIKKRLDSKYGSELLKGGIGVGVGVGLDQ